MHGIKHPVTGWLYEPEGEGRVRVTTTEGRTGVYTKDGRRIEGDKLDADPQLCGWIASPRGVHRMVNTTTH